MLSNKRFILLGKKTLRYLFLTIISLIIVYFVFNVQAGILAPGAPPAPTMKNLQEIYDILAGDSISFNGSGLNDMATGGTFTGATSLDYRVQIDSAGTPDTFSWSDDGGAIWDAVGVAITGSSQTLNNGVTIAFGASMGHITGDRWDFYVEAAGINGNVSEVIRCKTAKMNGEVCN